MAATHVTSEKSRPSSKASKVQRVCFQLRTLHSTQQQAELRGTSVGACLTRSGPDSNQGQGLSRRGAELWFVMMVYVPRTHPCSLHSNPCVHHGCNTCQIRKILCQLKNIKSAKGMSPTQRLAFNATSNRIAWDQRWSLSHMTRTRLKPRTGPKQASCRTLIRHDQLRSKNAPLQPWFNPLQASATIMSHQKSRVPAPKHPESKGHFPCDGHMPLQVFAFGSRERRPGFLTYIQVL